MKNYTVTLEVCETRTLTLEIPEIEAEDGAEACGLAKKMYLNGNSNHHFELCSEDTDDQHVMFSAAEEDE
mgnify:CR=1 FL=1